MQYVKVAECGIAKPTKPFLKPTLYFSDSFYVFLIKLAKTISGFIQENKLQFAERMKKPHNLSERAW